MERLSAETTCNIAAEVPVDTGRLRQSFRYRLKPEDTVALLYVLEDASYRCFLEYGTIYIEPRNFIVPQLPSLAQVAQAVRNTFNAWVLSGFN